MATQFGTVGFSQSTSQPDEIPGRFVRYGWRRQLALRHAEAAIEVVSRTASQITSTTIFGSVYIGVWSAG
jgi:hypothetical protein